MIPGRQFAALQIQGDRPYQEDDFGCVNDREPQDPTPDSLLLVLADGMGGHAGGAHASQAAIKTFIESFRLVPGNEVEQLESSLDAANQQIKQDTLVDPGLEGMGCTLVGVLFMDEGLIWVSVGDSPFYRWRNGELRQMNADHSMAPLIAMSVSRGEMTPEEAARHPQRNALRSALIGETIPQRDVRETPVRVQEGDKFILASDGIQTLRDEEMAEILNQDRSALTLSRDLVSAVEAKQRKGQDNTTVMVVTPYTASELEPVIDWHR